MLPLRRPPIEGFSRCFHKPRAGAGRRFRHTSRWHWREKDHTSCSPLRRDGYARVRLMGRLNEVRAAREGLQAPLVGRVGPHGGHRGETTWTPLRNGAAKRRRAEKGDPMEPPSKAPFVQRHRHPNLKAHATQPPARPPCPSPTKPESTQPVWRLKIPG